MFGVYYVNCDLTKHFESDVLAMKHLKECGFQAYVFNTITNEILEKNF
jgi:hypothetical protein